MALIPQVVRDLTYKKSQLKALEEEKGKEVIALIRKLDQEKEVRIALRRDLDELLDLTTNEALRERIESIETSVDPNDLTIGAEEFIAIAAQATDFRTKVVASEAELETAAKALGTVVDENLASWRTKEAEAKAVIERSAQPSKRMGSGSIWSSSTAYRVKRRHLQSGSANCARGSQCLNAGDASVPS